MKTLLIALLTIVILLALTTLLNAQPSLPSGPSQAPIDGGLGALAAAGGAYALKKLRDKKNNSDPSDITTEG